MRKIKECVFKSKNKCKALTKTSYNCNNCAFYKTAEQLQKERKKTIEILKHKYSKRELLGLATKYKIIGLVEI